MGNSKEMQRQRAGCCDAQGRYAPSGLMCQAADWLRDKGVFSRAI